MLNVKTFAIPIIPVTVTPAPSATPACLLFLSREIRKIPKLAAVIVILTTTKESFTNGPQLKSKTNAPKINKTVIWINTVKKLAKNFPAKIVLCGVGVVKSLGRVPFSSSVNTD